MDLRTIGVVLLLTFPFFILTVWAIANVLQKDFGSMGKKIMWLVIASVPFIGFLIYLIFGFRKGRKPQ